jgi:cobalt-zinc-cadmium efflux system membrane fusion protein
MIKGLPTIVVLVTIGGGWMLMHHINSGKSTVDDTLAVQEDASTDTLQLPPGKLNAGRFKSIPVEPKEIQHEHVVPGRLRYDQTKQVNVKAPMDGILSELVVAPGDHVATGKLIAVIRSPEVGQARATILKRQKELALAQQILQREQTLAKNLKLFSSMLDQGQFAAEIEQACSNLALGSYRQEILSAYSKMQLADQLIAKVRPLVDSGAVAGRVVREREAERQLAQTAYRTARDQASFAADQATQTAEANTSEAERQLNLAWQSLETLLGYKEHRETVDLSNEEALSRLEVRAPFEGTVESQGFASNERVMRGDSLIVLANTDSLTVEASIRENDWSAVELEAGAEVYVTIPALDDRVFSAKVRYFGREVQADTNSIPLVARIDNCEGLLRPGMFVRVTVPIGQARQA